MYEYLPGRLRGMTSFYGELVSKGDLCFDIGAHLGNRAYVLANLGCEVIAVEHTLFWLIISRESLQIADM